MRPAGKVLLGILCAALLGGGCSPVQQVWTRPDYAQTDRTQTLRLGVVTAPAPAGDAKLGALWSALARTYINQHRDFIVVEDYAEAAVPDDVCSGDLEGFLHLVPTATVRPGGAEVAVRASLSRCRDREVIWWAEAAGSWESEDDDLAAARTHWPRRFGAELDPWVVPSYRLLTATLERLPEPELPTEAYVREKIQLGE